MRDIQADFNTVFLGLRAQGFKHAIKGGCCRLLTADGLRCAIGHLVTDARVDDVTSIQANALYSHPIYADLQEAHDDSYHEDVEPLAFHLEAALREVAAMYNLEVPA